MRAKTLFWSALLLLFITSSAYAGALTVSVSLPSKSLTENEQVTVTVTVTNPSGTESDIITTLSSGTSWFTVVQACSTISSLSAGASGTSTCIIKPISTGSDQSLTATSEPKSGAAYSGTGSTSGINVASQSSSLTASITSGSSVSTSATFYVGVTVTAPSANDVVNARATISESGQCTVDISYISATQSLGNITKGTSKSPTNWKLTSSSAAGTCSITINVVSDNGGSASPSKSITVSAGGTGGNGGSGGGSGGGDGGGGTTSKAKVLVGEQEAIITIPSIAAKGLANFSIDSKTLAITEMKIRTITAVTNVKITVTKLDARPASVVSDTPGVVNQYMTIDKINISAGDIQNVTMDFKVGTSWISANNINESTIALYRYVNDQWNKLETVEVSRDGTNVYYQAVSPGLSVFAVSGEQKAGAVTPPAEEKPAEEKKPVEKIIEKMKKDIWKIILIFVGFVGIVGALIYFFKSHTTAVKKIRKS